MKKIDEYEYNISKFYIVAIMFCDYTYLNNFELTQITKFLDKLKAIKTELKASQYIIDPNEIDDNFNFKNCDISLEYSDCQKITINFFE